MQGLIANCASTQREGKLDGRWVAGGERALSTSEQKIRLVARSNEWGGRPLHLLSASLPGKQQTRASVGPPFPLSSLLSLSVRLFSLLNSVAIHRSGDMMDGKGMVPCVVSAHSVAVPRRS